MLQQTDTAPNIRRERAHQHNHQRAGETCPMQGKSWPWKLQECKLLQQIIAMLPWGNHPIYDHGTTDD